MTLVNPVVEIAAISLIIIIIFLGEIYFAVLRSQLIGLKTVAFYLSKISSMLRGLFIESRDTGTLFGIKTQIIPGMNNEIGGLPLQGHYLRKQKYCREQR